MGANMKPILLILAATAALGGCADFDRMGKPATDYSGPDKVSSPSRCKRPDDPPKGDHPSTPSAGEKDAKETCRGL